MNSKEFATLKRQYDRFHELKEFEKMLKEKPLQISEYRKLVEDMNLDSKEKTKYYNHLDNLKENKMIIDDIPESFEDFSVRAEQKGKVPIKSSVMKQMSQDEFSKLTTKAMALYDDLNGHQNVLHYKYRSRNGMVQETGNGISVKYLDTDDVETIRNAQRSHKEAKDIIGKTLSEIEVNGHKYQDFMKPKD